MLFTVLPLLTALVTAACLSAPDTWGIACVAVAVATGVGMLAWRRPSLTAGMIPVLMVPPEFLKTFAHELALLVTFVLVLVAGIRARRSWTWTADPIELAVAAFLAWGVVTWFWCPSTWWWFFALRKYGIGLVALWTASRLARSHRDSWDLLAGVALAALAISIATIAKAIDYGLLTSAVLESRREATNLGWGTSNYIAAILVLTLPTGLHLALNAPTGRLRALGWSTLPAMAIVMAISASRGGALLMVGGSILVLTRARFGRQSLVLMIAMAIILALMLAGPGSAVLISRFTQAKELGSVVVRLFLLREGWRRVVEHLPFGMGFGQGIVAPDYMAASSPHNFFVTLGYEVGIPGVALWCWVIAVIGRRAWRLTRDERVGTVAFALLLTLVLAVVNSTFEPTFEGLHFQFLFFWIVGLHLGTLARDARAPELAAGTPSLAPDLSPSR